MTPSSQTAPAPQRGSIPGWRASLGRRQALTGILFVLPPVAFVAIFFLVPLALTFWMSLNRWPLIGATHFIGLDNYTALLADSTFWQSLTFTVRYTALVTPLLFVVGLALALAVEHDRPGVGILRTIYFMPVVLGLASASYLWYWLLNPDVGIVDRILQDLHLADTPVQWLADPVLAVLAVIVMICWKTVGFSMLLLMTGLQSIPQEVREAARVDGAGRWVLLTRITLPLLRRTVALVLVFAVVAGFLAFDQFYIMTNGGPMNLTITAVYRIYDTSFIQFQLGYGAAMSVVLFGVLLVLTAAQLYLLRDTTEY